MLHTPVRGTVLAVGAACPQKPAPRVQVVPFQSRAGIPYYGLEPAEVDALDEHGTLVGVGSLGKATFQNGQGVDPLNAALGCSYEFTIPGLAERSFYRFEMTDFISGGHIAPVFSRNDLASNHWQVTLSL